MKRKLASIQKIINIEVHPNADRLEIVIQDDLTALDSFELMVQGSVK